MLWRNPAVRVLLLVLAFGIAGMHTLGHHEGHDGETATVTGHGTHAAGHAVAATMAADPAGLIATPPTGDLDPSQMCLAILTAGALLGLVLSAARITRRVPVCRWRPKPHSHRRTTRGPPGLRPTGLLLAEVAVLRI